MVIQEKKIPDYDFELKAIEARTIFSPECIFHQPIAFN